MSTPLEDWRENTAAQKSLERFWTSEHGQQFKQVLEFLGRPQVSAVRGNGTEAAIEGGLLYQQLAGHFALIDQISKLLPLAIIEAREGKEANNRVAKGKQLKTAPTT